jgi:hypothetical protein
VDKRSKGVDDKKGKDAVPFTPLFWSNRIALDDGVARTNGGSMMRRSLIPLCFALVIAGVCVPSLFAQMGYYSENGTISPWMNMFQRHPGPLDNYHSFVQPQMQLQRTLALQGAALQRHRTEIQSLGQAMSESQHEGGIPPTGTGSVFMDYSHYYSGGGSASSSRRAGQRLTRSSLVPAFKTSTSAASQAARR